MLRRSLAAKKTVPLHRSTHFYFLGGMALFLFIVQIVTGVLLSLYYKPSPDQAFESVRAIMTEVEFGWLIRSVHSWSANLLVGVLFLHLLTTYMMRAYRRPREITWVTGVLLLGLFMAFGFSGYLLPWNELAFFATRVGTAIVGVVPVVGDKLLLLARGGENVTGDTLARFYSLHVVVFPLVAFGLLGVHLFLVQKHGMSIPDREAAAQGGEQRVPSMPFVPHFLLRDMVGWYLALAILAALAALFPWELGAEGRSLWFGPGRDQARVVFPVHVPDAQATSGSHPGFRGRGPGRAVLRGLRNRRVAGAVLGLWPMVSPRAERPGRRGGCLLHRHDGLGVLRSTKSAGDPGFVVDSGNVGADAAIPGPR